MPTFTIGQPIEATLAHFEDDAIGELEFRLVDLVTGDPVFDWADTGIGQTTASEDGPLWTYEATRASDDLLPGVDRYQAQWRTSTAGPWVDDDEITLATVYGWDPPSIDDLAALMFARVTGEFGPLQTFTSATRLTATQAQVQITMAMGSIAAQLPAVLGVRYQEAARTIVVLTAAILTEPGYWPEDLGDQRSAQEAWVKERDAMLSGLLASISRDKAEEDEDESEAAGDGLPLYRFPGAYDWKLI